MNIGIDLRSLTETEPTGVTRAKEHLLGSLFNVAGKDQFKLFVNSYGMDTQPIRKRFGDYPNVRITERRYPNKLLNTSITALRRPKLDKIIGPVDCVFVPDIQFIALSTSCPSVVMVHDLSFMRFRELLSTKKRIWHRLARPIEQMERANSIIAVSEATKREIENLLPHLGKRTVVIPHGFDQSLALSSTKEDRERVRSYYNLPKRYILSVATNEPRKNLETIIKAFNIVRKNISGDLQLVIVGSRGWSDDWLESFDIDTKCRVMFTGYVPDQDLSSIYHDAEIMVFPSLAEGFGFPLLESIVSGTPVITSNMSAPTEIVGRETLTVNPYSVNDLTKGIEMLINDSALQRSLLEEGKRTASGYTWEQAAASVIQLINNARRVA